MSSDSPSANPLTMYPASNASARPIAHPASHQTSRQVAREIAPGHGQTILPPLAGLACVGAGLIATNLLGEFDRMSGFIANASGSLFSATNEVMYPSAHAYLGLVLSGPAGGLIIGSLAACMGLGVLGLWSGRRRQTSNLSQTLGLLAALLLPLLLLDYMIYSTIEFTSAQAIQWAFNDQPTLQRVWVPVALSCAAVQCLTANWLILRWARRRVDRPRVGLGEPAAG